MMDIKTAKKMFSDGHRSLVTDALDACGGAQEQQELLNMMCQHHIEFLGGCIGALGEADRAPFMDSVLRGIQESSAAAVEYYKANL